MPPRAVVRALEDWSERVDTTIGPASSVRAVTDAVLIPLLTILGFQVSSRDDTPDRTVLQATSTSPTRIVVPVLVLPSVESLDRGWRQLVLEGIRADARWGFCCSHAALRVVDAHRTWARRYLEFDLGLVASEPETRRLFWSLVRCEALNACPPVLDRAVELSERHGVATRTSLGRGVLAALARLVSALASRRRPHDPELLLEQALTVLYRILFLLFAEARGLVPLWHPIYRERYSLDAIVSTLATGRRSRGLWRALLAISRLAHAGCTAGTLQVTAFNGRLFAPTHAAVFEQAHVDDAVVGEAVMALSLRRSSAGLSRISYRELDVEQLGAVYERVLEYTPTTGERPDLAHTRDARQASGSFYTPRAVTAWLVRTTLDPLVRDRSADEILDLRVLDPAMGSGAFLVGVCRYLAEAVEERLIREGKWHPGDVTAAERALLRREVAQRCLFGVDINPMAVQLARLSLWLATLSSDKPLTFLDHHLVTGNSLIGATLDDVLLRPGGSGSRPSRAGALPLFDQLDAAPALEQGVRSRLQIARDPDDSAAIIAAKEKTLAALQSASSPLGRWRTLLDLWCAAWFWEEGTSPGRALFRELSSGILGRTQGLPEHFSRPLLAHAEALAAHHRFLHWPLAFPEVFADEHGEPLPNAGFDAVVGNPPWDMIRGDSGEGGVRAARRAEARRFVAFVRESGVYRVDAASHLNRYQLFLERAAQLTRAGGRLGLLLPSGLLTDAGAAPLRRHVFDRLDIDSLTGFDNRAGIFPVHRSVRFVLVTGTAGRPTTATTYRSGLRSADDLERPDNHPPVVVSRSLLSRLSGSDDLGLPVITSGRDLTILDKISANVPWLGSPDGWNVRFGRELNASDDRVRFVLFSGKRDRRPVVEGKQIEPFHVSLESSRFELRRDRLDREVERRTRLAYRDVASATNRLTLIAAVIPARAVTVHTLFCSKTPLTADALHVLCALLNSFVANYLIRQRVNTHVTAALMSRLPVPVVRAEHPAFTKLARLSRRLSAGAGPAEPRPEYSTLQALVARLYGLDTGELEHVLATFPLIPDEVRHRVLAIFRGTIVR